MIDSLPWWFGCNFKIIINVAHLIYKEHCSIKTKTKTKTCNILIYFDIDFAFDWLNTTKEQKLACQMLFFLLCAYYAYMLYRASRVQT